MYFAINDNEFSFGKIYYNLFTFNYDTFSEKFFLLKSYVISRILDIHVEEKGPRRKRF